MILRKSKQKTNLAYVISLRICQDVSLNILLEHDSRNSRKNAKNINEEEERVGGRKEGFHIKWYVFKP